MLAFCFRNSKGLILPLLLCFVGLTRTYAQANPAVQIGNDGNQTKSVQAPSSGPIYAQDYIIGPDDLLNIYILDVPELSRDYRVSNSGDVTLPVLAKPLPASGLTLAQFSEQLSHELQTQGLVVEPHINISVDQSRVHSVAITGAVKHPQIYAVLGKTTFLDVLSQAEGLADDAGTIAIVRRGDIGMQASHPGETASGADKADPADTITVDLKRLLESSNPGLNIAIYPGDRITIPRAGIVYVVGAVNKPGGFPMNTSSHGMTVLQALALASDTKGTAQKASTLILRSDPQAPEGRQRIPVDLKAVLQGKQPDPNLQAEDILFVPDSAGKRALGRSIESIVQVATGVAIFDSRF